ncbi:amidohydrolase [Paenibacillaceae bacterium]|nr:amidohydrolase [Paenibacillaceae bacterium]
MRAIAEVREALHNLYPEMIGWRRYLHQHPELSYGEKETARYIAAELREMGCEVTTDVGGHGVVAVLRGAAPGRTVALRADIDALAIQDEKTVDYASKVPGVMHACGHDAHTATLLSIAKFYSSRSNWSGERRLLFQPAEEISPGGAQAMIGAGVLEGVDAIYGVHLWTPLQYGLVASRAGALMAAADEFSIEVSGNGGHGGLPHQSVDAIVVGSSLVQALQTIVSRNVNPLEPAVLSIGSFQAGQTANVIAGKAVMKGTVRAFNSETRELVRNRLGDMVKQTCELYGARGELDYREGYPPVVNDAREAERFFRVAADRFTAEAVRQSELIMAAEDFAYYLGHKPGCFMFVGAGHGQGTDTGYPHHHAKFDLDERAMLMSAELMIAMAENYALESAG